MTTDVEWVERFKREKLLRADESLTSTQKLVGYALATFANKDGTRISPGVETLTRCTSLGRSTVMSARKVLLDLGWLAQTRRAAPRQSRRESTPEFRLCVPRCVHPIKEHANGSSPEDPFRELLKPNGSTQPTQY